MRGLLCTFGLLAIACGPSVVGDDGDGGGDGGDAAGGDDDDGAGDADPDASGLAHTYVKLQLFRGLGEDANPFGGTGRVAVDLVYGDCILDFYARHPELTAAGAEGRQVFGSLAEGGEGWTDRLCAPDDDFATCGVVSISQSLLDVPEFKITVVYAVEDNIEGRMLRVGPLPTTATANCGAGGLPEVRAGAQLATGLDGTGATIWTTQSFSPSELVAGQDPPISVYAED